MTRELVFHLGDRKTGSTSIQDTLRRQNWETSVATLSFPAERLHHADVAKSVIKGEALPRKRRALTELAAGIRESTADIVVISSENFEDSDPETLRVALEVVLPEFAEGARLIAYVRPHADRILSSFAERIKLGLFDGTLANYINHTVANSRFEYYPRFNQWRKAFGSQFELRPMIRSNLYQNCVVRDFMSFALGTTDFALKSDPASNESLCVEDLAALALLHRELGRHLNSRKSAQAIGRNFAILLQSHPRRVATRPTMEIGLYERVLQTYRADAMALDKEFFAGQPMMDALIGARTKAAEKPQSLRAEDYYTIDEIRMLSCWSSFVQQMSRIAPEQWVSHFTGLRTGRLKDEGSAGHADENLDAGLSTVGRKQPNQSGKRRLTQIHNQPAAPESDTDEPGKTRRDQRRAERLKRFSQP